MAARWGAGEETLTACNMDFFHMDTLDESPGQMSADTLEALQSSLDPAILSFLEETPTIDTKGLDEESEATLLTALTEILDNVDEENLSPFDTLPDAELLSNQRGREHSPFKRLLCLSRSPPEKDAPCGTRTLSTGKNLQRMQLNSLQRSDGEEEEDGSFTLSPIKDDSCPDSDLMDWEGLTLPLTFEQEGEDGVSVSLGDLVRHMHPYCMTVCVENEEGEQVLPEGGIVLEVVDQGENGEPILAIPDMSLPFSVPPEEQAVEQDPKVSVDVDEEANDSSELIVVDDDDDVTVSLTPMKVETAVQPSHVKDQKVDKKEEVREKSPSRKKKKKKCKEPPKSEPFEGRVLRSARKSVKEMVEKIEIKTTKVQRKQKVLKSPVASTKKSVAAKLNEMTELKNEALTKTTTTTVLPVINAEVGPSQSVKSDEPSAEKTLASAVSVPPPNEALTHAPSADSKAAPSADVSASPSESPAAAPGSASPPITPPANEAPAVPEPKPKSLSLAEYRRLRQQKKPAPVEKKDANSTKWPSLPELPKELPPIPCLPDLNPKDPRRFTPPVAKKEADEVKPAWQPRGPGAPPTPEALLAPPAYMVASSSRASLPALKPQQAPEASKQAQQLSAPAPHVVKNTAPPQCSAAQSADPCTPQNFGPSVKLAPQPAYPAERKSSPVLSGGKKEVNEMPHAQPETSPETTTEVIKPAAATASSASVSKTTVDPQRVSEVAPLPNPVIPDSRSTKPATVGTPRCLVSSGAPFDLQRVKPRPVVLKAREKPTTAVKLQKAADPKQELIEAFTTEIGIEAADLTSLLEQFEETQAKVEHSVPEVSGRAAAVGNSSVEVVPEKSVVERVRAHDFSSTAALTPPATPPHHMWKPLTPVALLGKNKIAESSKSANSKVIQIEARPLPSIKSRSKAAPAPVDPEVVYMDHDYCLPNSISAPGEPGKRWNVKQQPAIMIKPIKPQAAATTATPPAAPTSLLQGNSVGSTKAKEIPPTQTLEKVTSDKMAKTSILETPDASPARREIESTLKDKSPKRRHFGRSYRHHASSSRSPSPTHSPKERTGGRSRKRKSHRSPSPMSSYSESDSHSSRSRSRSFSPKSKRYRGHRSRSSSSSSSCSSRSCHSVSRSPPRRRRYSYSSSRSGSWSRSRSRSQSPHRRAQWNRSRRLYSPTYQSYCGQGTKPNAEEMKRRKEKAIEERRIVYVGKIRGTMTQKELRERFSYFGEIEECTLHFRDQGDNYGFVTYYDTKDAFTAIENGSKLRKPDELPFDLCFGGRRQFCKATYADLDSSREYDPLPGKGKYHALDFDTLLKQAKQNLKR